MDAVVLCCANTKFKQQLRFFHGLYKGCVFIFIMPTEMHSSFVLIVRSLSPPIHKNMQPYEKVFAIQELLDMLVQKMHSTDLEKCSLVCRSGKCKPCGNIVLKTCRASN